MPNSILDLYNNWQRVEQAKKIPITNPGKFTAGTENSAANQAVDFLSTKDSLIGTDAIKGFTPRAQKNITEYPIRKEPILEIARVLETGGTHIVPRLSEKNRYSDITPRD